MSGYRRILATIATPSTLLLVTTACSTSPAAPTHPNAASQTFTYVDNQQVMIGWDPSTAYSEEVEAMVNMYEGLTRYDPAVHKAVPLLATSWTANRNATVWTFHLRHGVLFHTGRPLTSQAAKAAIERTIKLGQSASYIWGSVRSINTPTPYTLVFHLKYPAPLDLIASADYTAWIYDTKAAGGGNLAKWFAAGHDAGTGPYTVQQWNRGQETELRLKTFPHYWGGWTGQHYKYVVFDDVPTANTAVDLLRAGQASFIKALTPQIWASLRGDPSIRTTTSPSFENQFIMLNTLRPPLNNVIVRQALAEGINYPGLDKVLKGAFRFTSGIVPPGLWGYSTNLPNYSYDPSKAKALLAREGYGPGKKQINLSLTYITGDPIETPSAQIIKSSWAPLNVNVTLEPLQWPVLWAKTKSANLSQRQSAVIYQWWPDYPDPYSWFTNLYATQKQIVFNASYYSNKVADSMMQRAEKVAAYNRAQATQLYRQLQAYLLRQAPAIPTGTLVYQRAMLASVHGFRENPLYPNCVFAYYLHPGQ